MARGWDLGGVRKRSDRLIVPGGDTVELPRPKDFRSDVVDNISSALNQRLLSDLEVKHWR